MRTCTLGPGKFGPVRHGLGLFDEIAAGEMSKPMLRQDH
jgi:hypothetical protein